MNPRQLMAFGSGIGIEAGETHLEVTVARVRPGGIDVLDSTTIRNYRERQAAEWGAEYARFLTSCGAAHLTATVLIPRRDTIVRYVALPGVAQRDMAAAIALQIETMHPYGEQDAAYAWSRAGNGALVGIVQKSTLDSYRVLFEEAGIAVGAFTFSASVLYAARRLPVAANIASAGLEGFLALAEDENGSIEVYGESPARPLFSAEFETGAARATSLAAAELRLPPETAALSLEQILPAPRTNPVGNDLARRALPFAAAVAGACPWLTPAANLLPAELRSSNSRARLVPSLVLAGVLLVLAGGLFAHSALEDRRYLASLEAEIRKLDPQARQAMALDSEIAHAQARAHLLDEFRARSKSNLDALNELTVILAPPTWTNMLQIAHDAVTLTGETEQAAPLLKLLDASPYFANSQFVGGLSRNGGNEQFQIRAARKVRP
ncbi:MAG: PilN domain-containing protein [Candidatus Solibacter usitatus]|nr:PilN domain-containing protein [Candidatus Solibacter usitatus]